MASSAELPRVLFVDDEKRVLTLEADGPSMADPNVTATYRDQIELVSADAKRMVSSMLGADGSWTTFLTMEARRIG